MEHFSRKTTILAIVFFSVALMQPTLLLLRQSTAQRASLGPYGDACFAGLDRTDQFCVGFMAGASEHWQALGGLTGNGASFVAMGAAPNVDGNFVAKGNGNINFGNNGNGQLASALDPGGAVNAGGQVMLTPSGAGTSNPVKVGNSKFGTKLDCGSDEVCQPMASFTPSSSTQTCMTGSVAWDASFVYVCVSTNVWKRTTLANF